MQLPTASWPALGSTAVLRLAVAVPSLPEAVAIVRRELAAVESACSRFREDSELSRLNAAAGGPPVAIGPLLCKEIELALRAAELTDGLLDPCLGAKVEQAGYDRDWELIGTADEGCRPVSHIAVRPRAAWRSLQLDRRGGYAHVPVGVKLDLGATAKASAADRACAAVHERLGVGALVALGGDIATAGRSPDGGWQVHVTDDHRAGVASPGQRILLSCGGLATSSILARTWVRGTRRMHHIIDPRSGLPAETRWRTVSVAAADCLDANIASTAALLREGDAPAWLAARGLPARLVSRSGSVATVAGWPREDRTPKSAAGTHTCT